MQPTQKDFSTFRNPQRGTTNPQDLTNPLWIWAIQTEDSGYIINETFNGPSPFDAGPCWSFDRFGRSRTTLPDDRVILIAGEHEDSYDPDFYIYNDLVVITPEGQPTIYAYPEADFPPTDFHSATLVVEEIILIGNLGYPHQREENKTQVLRLNTQDLSITPQATTGGPGWISSHQAQYDPERNAIIVTDGKRWTSKHDLIEVFATWELNLSTWEWQLIDQKNWSQFQLARKDGDGNNLFELRNHVDMADLGIDLSPDFADLDLDLDEESLELLKESHQEMADETNELIKNTDLSLIPSLYHPSIPHTPISTPETDIFDEEEEDDDDETYNHFLIEVNDITIRFIEDSHNVTMRIEGELPEAIVTQILTDITANLSKFENTQYTHTRLPTL